MARLHETMAAAGAGAMAGRPGGFHLVNAVLREPSLCGGVERMVDSVNAEFVRIRPDWKVDTIVAFRENSRLAGIDGLSDVIASFRLGWRLRKSNADLIFVHCPECLWGIRLLCGWRGWRSGPPLIAVWHGAGPTPYLVLRRPGHPLARLLAWFRTTEERRALWADGHIAVHERVANVVRSRYRLRSPITVIEDGIGTAAHMVPRPARSAPEGELRVLWAGQIGYRKGLDVALAAVAGARQDIPGIRLQVAGVLPGQVPGVDAGWETEGVEWLGIIPPDRMPEVYRHADLLIFPSRYESFGLVVLEAMAAGLPVITSTAVGGCAAVDGRNGFVIDGHDPADYAAALRSLADPELRAKIAEINRRDILGRYTIEACTRDYIVAAERLAAMTSQ